MKLGILETGHANIRSLTNTLERLGCSSEILTSQDQFSNTDRLILPGVGAFPAVMKSLRSSGLDQAIKEFASQKPVLGICLGMQILLDKSDELSGDAGLSLITGEVSLLPDTVGTIPHIGWNELSGCNEPLLLKGVKDKACAYFVHSYQCHPVDIDRLIFTDFYGKKIVAGFEKNHIFGVQFHPEKSQQVGEQVLKNFIEYKMC